MKSRVQELADEIKDEPRRSDLDNVRVIIDPKQAHAALQSEIMREMAGALGRAERRVTDAIAALSKLPVGTEAWESQRQVALRLRRDLSIHREALRFPRDPAFNDDFPIPDRVKPRR